MKNAQLHRNNLDDLKNDLGEISGFWNGKDSGLAEEQAGYADDCITKIKELEELLIQAEFI